jgi:hypothetical protein
VADLSQKKTAHRYWEDGQRRKFQHANGGVRGWMCRGDLEGGRVEIKTRKR